MTDPNEAGILVVVSDTTNLINEYNKLVTDQTAGIRQRVRNSCTYLQDDLDLRITSCETQLVRISAILTYNAEFHILKAYHHASPSLWLFLVGLYGFIQVVVSVINTINGIVRVITGANLAYWLDQLMPGFQEAWNNIMNKISEFSAVLGWGVDGVNHLLNTFDQSADLWCMVTGKDRAVAQVEKIRSMNTLAQSYTLALQKWQDNPGEQISKHADMWSKTRYSEGATFINKWVDKIGVVGDKAEDALTRVGTITSELLGIQNNMPAFIAANIPSGIWDGITRVDTTINDRILPALTNITDRIDELDAMLDAYQAKAAEISDRLLHPGDLLAEIDNLPDYARQNQLVKIDGVTSTLLRESNEAAFAAVEGDLRNFGIIAAALAAPPPPLSFMTLELPGRSPGITPEPHESWILTSGDY